MRYLIATMLIQLSNSLSKSRFSCSLNGRIASPTCLHIQPKFGNEWRYPIDPNHLQGWHFVWNGMFNYGLKLSYVDFMNIFKNLEIVVVISNHISHMIIR